MFRVCIGLAIALCLARESEGNELEQIQSLMNQQAYVQAFRLGQKLEYRLANSNLYNQMMIQLATRLDHPEEAFFALSRLRFMEGESRALGQHDETPFYGVTATSNLAGVRFLRSSIHSQ